MMIAGEITLSFQTTNLDKHVLPYVPISRMIKTWRVNVHYIVLCR